MSVLHALLQSIRGMCSDEEPWPLIDARLAEAVEIAKDLESVLAAARGVEPTPVDMSRADLGVQCELIVKVTRER